MTGFYAPRLRVDPFKKDNDRFRSKQLKRFDTLQPFQESVYDQRQAVDEIRGNPCSERNRKLRESADRNQVKGRLFAERLHSINFRWDMSRDELVHQADELAFISKMIMASGRKLKRKISDLFNAIGLADAIPHQGLAQRLQDPYWWRRLLSREQRRQTEQQLRELGKVSKRDGLYISQLTFSHWRSGQIRNTELMAEIVLIDVETGEIISLEEAAKSSTANLENRRAELMTRIRGNEELAKAAGLAPLFITLTCPSRYHCYSGNRENPKYDQTTPREGQDYLNGVWQRIRAKINRNDLLLYGLRIAEPHHDGCPHWHLLLFVRPEEKTAITSIITDYALQENGDEPGAKKNRVKVVALDKSGQAAGYVAKYVAKNIDGFKVGEDYEADGADAVDTAQRVQAWASTWGIRQFQFFGDAAVSVYRELRRVARNKVQAKLLKGKDQEMMQAADQGDWGRYAMLNGGIGCKQKDRPMRPYYSEIKPVSNTLRIGRYGDPLKMIAGIKTQTDIVVSRVREWVLNFGSASDPWPCVNKCTVPFL